jgi:signal transduction histidine kinase/ligand-binding sensor domain-containing protein
MMYSIRKFVISAFYLGLFIAFASLLLACGNSVTATLPHKEAVSPNNPVQEYSSQQNIPLILENLKFKHLSVEAGLSHSTVNCILQDSQGFMWFGTDDGLNKYDGYSFTIYKHNPDDPFSISHNQIWSLFEDSSGTLWIGTYGGGLNRFDRDSGKFTHYDASDFQNLTDELEEFRNVVWYMAENPPGVLWIATYGGGLVKFEVKNEVFTSYAPDPADPNLGGHEWISALLVDGSGKVWMGTHSEGLDLFDPATGKTTTFHHNPNDPDSLSSDWIREIIQDPSGTIWIGTYGGGLNRLDPATQAFSHYRHNPEDPASLSDDFIWSIYEDRSGLIWIGTYSGGLDAFDPQSGTFTHFHSDPARTDSLSSDGIRSIYQDESGILWVGTRGGGVNKSDLASSRFSYYQGDSNNPRLSSDYQVLSLHEDEFGVLWIGTSGGLEWLDRKIGEWQHYPSETTVSQNQGNLYVKAIHEDSSGNFWIGSANGVFRYDRKTQRIDRLPYNPPDPGDVKREMINCIMEDRQGFIWVGTLGRGLSKYDPATGEFIYYQQRWNPDTGTRIVNTITDNYILDVIEDTSGRLWIGTQDGLNLFDRTTGDWLSFKHDPSNPDSPSHNWITTLYQDPSGILWIGTQGGGLNRLDLAKFVTTDPASYIFTHYQEQVGLANDMVFDILDDNNGALWIATANGLSRFDSQTKTFKNFGARDGLPINEFATGVLSDSGEMFFGGTNGFISFNPDQLTDNPYLPPVVLTSLQQNGKDMNTGQAPENLSRITIRWPDNSFEFGFATLSYTQPEKNQHAYMLERFDKDWNYVGSRRFGRYTNLPGGTYTLRLKGSNNDGVWNEAGLSIQVKVVPPFWDTGWFRGMVALVLLIGAAVGYRLRIRSLEWRSRDLEKQVATRTVELQHEIDQRYKVEETLRQHEREKATIEERNRLARELHDSVTQSLYGVTLYADAATRLLDTGQMPLAVANLNKLRDTAKGALEEMRLLIFELRPPVLEQEGLAAALEARLEAVEERVGLKTQLELEGEGELSQDIQEGLYRIALEALNNVLKHAQASCVTVSLIQQPQLTELIIVDDGVGFDLTTALKSGGLGLQGMKERAEQIGGKLTVKSQLGMGTTVQVEVKGSQ